MRRVVCVCMRGGRGELSGVRGPDSVRWEGLTWNSGFGSLAGWLAVPSRRASARFCEIECLLSVGVVVVLVLSVLSSSDECVERFKLECIFRKAQPGVYACATQTECEC